MAELQFITQVHQKTKRNYLERVTGADKAECAVVAKRFDRDYFDGDRKYGYGGYRYDGRWVAVAQAMAKHYKLKSGDRILDIGCGKGFLLHDFATVVPGVVVEGLDISSYAIGNAMPDVKPFLKTGSAVSLPYPDRSFDLVISINTLHNLQLPDLERALREIGRVGRSNKYVVNDAYRNDREKMNLMYWQLTCECFYTPAEWEWIFAKCGYQGDHGFIYYE